MNYLALTLPSLPQNLGLDEALLLQVESNRGRQILRLWEWPTPAVVLGAGSMLAVDVDEGHCAADAVPILRRSSGGGTVLLGSGCLLYTLVLAYDTAPALGQIASSYGYILDRLCRSLAIPDLRLAGTSDLALGDCKVSGNAQQRKRHYLLHHGTLLYAFDTSALHRYLRLPARQPDYRQHREHADFVTNLPLSRDELTRRLRSAFGADNEVTAWPEESVRELVHTKYAQAEWTRRR